MKTVRNRAPSERNPFPFEFCAQMAATIWMSCPACGQFSCHQVQRGSWKIRCTNNECRKFWGVGLLLHEIDGHAHGGRSPQEPRDTVFMTSGIDPIPWRSGDPVHRAVESEALQRLRDRQPESLRERL